MTRQEFHRILVNGKILYDLLGMTEFFDRMDDLAIEYYQTGHPDPGSITTEIITEDQYIMAVRSKVGLNGEQNIQPTPKKTRQGKGKHTKYAATSRNSARKRYRGQGK